MEYKRNESSLSQCTVELRNVICLNTSHGNSERLAMFRLRERDIRVENNSSTSILMNSIETGKWRLYSSGPSAVLHFQPDLVLVTVVDSRGQILTRVIQGTDHFPSIFSNGSYVWIPLDVWDGFVLIDAQGIGSP